MNKNILFLHSSADLYGASKIFKQTISIFKECGFKCYVILPNNGQLMGVLKENNINVKIFNLGIIRKKYLTPFGIFNRIYKSAVAFYKIHRHCKKYNINTIYSNTAAVLIGVIYAKVLNKKHIWHIHEILQQPRIFARLINTAINNLSYKVIVVSREVEKNIKLIGLGANNNINLVYNGIETPNNVRHNTLSIKSEFGINKNNLVIGMIARVHYWKGQLYFLEIANHLNKKYNNITFIMAGDPYPGYEYLLDEINNYKKLMNMHNVIDLGFQNDPYKIICAMDIFILPSILPDPLPTTCLEAMILKKPVVATSHGGALEMVISNYTGIHIPINTPHQAAYLIEPLIENCELRLTMGYNGFKRATSIFSPSQFSNNIKKIIGDL